MDNADPTSNMFQLENGNLDMLDVLDIKRDQTEDPEDD